MNKIPYFTKEKFIKLDGEFTKEKKKIDTACLHQISWNFGSAH